MAKSENVGPYMGLETYNGPHNEEQTIIDYLETRYDQDPHFIPYHPDEDFEPEYDNDEYDDGTEPETYHDDAGDGTETEIY